MATPETRNEQIAPVGLSQVAERADDGGDTELALMNRVNLPIIIGALVAFSVVLVGFAIGRPYVLLGGVFALGTVGMAWNVAGAITVWKMARSWFTARRVSRYESRLAEGGTDIPR